MVCPINKIDSNVTSTYYAEEECLKVLPASPVWRGLEPNSFSDFGGEISTMARAPITSTRQRQKGTVVDLDASVGFNQDLTQNNLLRLLQGFFFADAREKVSTAPLNGTQVPLTGVTTTDFQAASGLGSFLPGHLIKASGFDAVANNGLKKVTVVAAGAVTVEETLVADASPAADSKIEACGFEFAASDINITASATSIVVDSTIADFTTLGLTVGETVFIGGDATVNQFATNSPGYGRVKSISTNALELDDTTFTATTETGTGLEIQIFFGTVLQNEATRALQKRRSVQFERQLGEDADGVQSEYVTGCIANELTLNIPLGDKLNVDLSFVGLDFEQRSGLVGIKAGAREGILSENAYNTSIDIYRQKISVDDGSTVNPDALFAYVSEANLTIANGVATTKAIGVLGGFDASAGDFLVGGSLTPFFTTVEAIAAVRNNSDVSYNLIAAQQNNAIVFDVPLLTLSGGRVTVEKDSPITIPLEEMASENEAGYTLLTTWLPYVPTVGMPV